MGGMRVPYRIFPSASSQAGRLGFEGINAAFGNSVLLQLPLRAEGTDLARFRVNPPLSGNVVERGRPP